MNGSAPNETAGTLYAGPVTVGFTTTINAIAFADSMQDSPVAIGVFTATASR
jgi:hypothetical protein